MINDVQPVERHVIKKVIERKSQRLIATEKFEDFRSRVESEPPVPGKRNQIRAVNAPRLAGRKNGFDLFESAHVIPGRRIGIPLSLGDERIGQQRVFRVRIADFPFFRFHAAVVRIEIDQIGERNRNFLVIAALEDVHVAEIDHAVHIHVVTGVIDAPRIRQIDIVRFQVILDHPQRRNPRHGKVPRGGVDRPHFVLFLIDLPVPVQVTRHKNRTGQIPRGSRFGGQGQFIFPVRNIE